MTTKPFLLHEGLVEFQIGSRDHEQCVFSIDSVVSVCPNIPNHTEDKPRTSVFLIDGIYYSVHADMKTVLGKIGWLRQARSASELR